MPQTPDEDLIYIPQLAEIINREQNTIRKWEREGKLPKHLVPKRGRRGWRCWTHGQVYGKRGILEWMKTHDMRPGRTLTSPDDEERHVRNLRRPKYLSKRLITNVRTMVKNKASAEEIVDEIFPHTKYASKANLETALRRYFRAQGWVFPPSKRRRVATKK
jgi:hypothetical protein